MEELPKAYEAKQVEKKLYDFWESKGFFTGDPDPSKLPYCIVMPPPNVTGVLHMGHALANSLQDILIRWKRMQGFNVLWVPGTDHAGIATQTVVERHLIRTQQKRRKDFERDEFIDIVWKWKEANEHTIINQLKRLGCSCDWSKLRFTMDSGNNAAVRTMFKKLYDKGLIYRGDYLVNWDPVTQTAIADDEVEYEDRESFLWYFKYPLEDGSGYARIATTRPETMLGDTGIAVSPEDHRYHHLIGKNVMLPLMNRLIPIIADYHVDPEFGTGMVKITPAHDPNDYQIGLSHELPMINIMTPDGKINENGGEFQGLTMEAARKKVVSRMKELGYLEKVEPLVNRIGVSYTSKAVIEPYLSKQWFIKMREFAVELRNMVLEGNVRLTPSNWESTYFHWIDNLRDWCISRQLWWGHRIPVWYKIDNPEEILCWDGPEAPPQVLREPDQWVQEGDVLDTWFSAALWPFSTLGWPTDTPELRTFYPNSLLVTGHDILFFWVARMLMMGQFEMGTPPFPQTFLHGLIYGKSYWRELEGGGIQYVSPQERLEYDLGKPVPKDVFSKWEKMSKSKGNIIDPLEIIEQYGTDAMRMALCASSPQSRQIDLDRRRFEEFKNFSNKIWNGARFAFMHLAALTPEQFAEGLDLSRLRLEDHWILFKLREAIQEVSQNLEQYIFDQAAAKAYDFFWKEFCSYYLEISKPILFGKHGDQADKLQKQKLLLIVLNQAIRLMHPMAPFITEELFLTLKEKFGSVNSDKEIDFYTQESIQALRSESCMTAPYPTSSKISHEGIKDFEFLRQIIYTIRNIRGEMKIPPGMETDVFIIGKERSAVIKENVNILTSLVKVGQIILKEEDPEIPFASTGMVHHLKILIPLPSEMVEQEKVRLNKEFEKLQSSLEKIQQQLSNADFISKAPPQLIENQQKLHEKLLRDLKEIQNKLNHI